MGLENDPRAFEITSFDISNRLDATHHVPVSRSAVHKLGESRFELVNLSDRVDHIYLAQRLKRIKSEEKHGIPFLQGSHLPAMKIHGPQFISTKATKNIEDFLIKPNWVLITRSGTIGRLGISTEAQNGWAASEHILRIIPKSGVYHPGFLCSFLATPYGQHQLKAKIYGGVVDELTPEDTGAVLVPDVPYLEQEKIGQHSVEVYELRDKANILENEAIAELEAVISG